MAVYERTYKAYRGALTPGWSRFLVISRYALKNVFASRLFTALFVLTFVAPLVASIRIYLVHNAEAINVLDLGPEVIRRLLAIEVSFFRNWLLIPQTALAFVVALIVGPALLSPDLRNNAMPLYLSRPLGRWEYVLGKLTVLAVLLSAVTWVPGLVLFALQGYLAGGEWLADYFWVGPALFVASWVWILTLSLVALAVSAWVKWKPLAALIFLALPFVLNGLGGVVNLTFRTRWGDLLQIFELLPSLWNALLRAPADPSALPAAATWAVFAATWASCLLILRRKIRAYEVERS